MTQDLVIEDVSEIGPFCFRWPAGTEEFEKGWEFRAVSGGHEVGIKHGIGGRTVYGTPRVHTVTWLNGQPVVEGVAVDDYLYSRQLASVLRIAGKKHVRSHDHVPSGYESFEIVWHNHAIAAPRSPASLAVLLAEDHLTGWATHALLRARDKGRNPQVVSGPASQHCNGALSAPHVGESLEPVSDERTQALTKGLLELGEGLARRDPVFSGEATADQLIKDSPFAFLVAVIADQGIIAERAWALPHRLKGRLGHLDPTRIAGDPAAVRDAFRASPSLHRFNDTVADWVAAAAQRVVDLFGGDAERIWGDSPTAVELIGRLDAFAGIGQKKAAMAVEILARDLKCDIKEFSGSDIAYDVHVRRVMLRTGLAERDEIGHMIAVARTLNPSRPGLLDFPLWHIGRTWCGAGIPACESCPLSAMCAKHVGRAAIVRGA